MRKLIFIAAAMFLVVGCQCYATGAAQNMSSRAATTVSIEVYPKQRGSNDVICVKKTKTTTDVCGKDIDDFSCNVPGDTIVWSWKGAKIDRPFSIKLTSTGNPFVANTKCTDPSNTVTCVVEDTATLMELHKYAVIVDDAKDPIPDCNLDPFILIY